MHEAGTDSFWDQPTPQHMHAHNNDAHSRRGAAAVRRSLEVTRCSRRREHPWTAFRVPTKTNRISQEPATSTYRAWRIIRPDRRAKIHAKHQDMDGCRSNESRQHRAMPGTRDKLGWSARIVHSTVHVLLLACSYCLNLLRNDLHVTSCPLYLLY